MYSCVRLRHAVNWATWAHSIKSSERHPEVVTTILRAVDEQHQSSCFMAVVVASVQSLEEVGVLGDGTGPVLGRSLADTLQQ